MQRVLVIGGAGYIGGSTVDVLVERGFDVRVYDSLLYEEQYRKPVDFVFGDVRDGERLKPHLAWADTVIWLAALVGDGACALNPDVAMEINRDTVAWLSRNYDGRIVFPSTCSVYGAQDGLLDEHAPEAPLSVYGKSKLEAEQFLTDKNALVFRLGTLYGVGDLFSRLRLDLVVNTLTVRAHTQGKLTVFGGEQYRPLIHVRDVAEAIADAHASEMTGVFNLHSENMRVWDLAQQVATYFPGVRIERTEMKFEDTRNYRVSSDKARNSLGYVPKLSLEDGVAELKALLDQKRLTDVNNVRYVNQGFLAQMGASR